MTMRFVWHGYFFQFIPPEMGGLGWRLFLARVKNAMK